MRLNNRGKWIVFALFAGGAAVQGLLILGITYVVLHFILKFW